ncbi:MAG: hypothetical protein M3066_04510 [Actinomycetota bacterium]|nr:hypothetical protein [Actinomycetota bacterium]
MEFDSRGVASLDGAWLFFPGDHDLADLDDSKAADIIVPGLWEAQGWLDLDGTAWYRRSFSLSDTDGHWTLRFGAVMDRCEVFVNGIALGGHDGGFTPFELDPTRVLRSGDNDLAVRVIDPSLADSDHRRMPHGKQGWASHLFPSPPSFYMTYGGIWQGVTLRRHGPVVIRDVFVNGDPAALTVAVEIGNVGARAAAVRVGVRTLGLLGESDVEVAAGQAARVKVRLGPATAAGWSPDDPVLHEAVVDVVVNGHPSDSSRVRFGLRTVRVVGRRILFNGVPWRMRSVLVQGFRADSLYAEGTRGQIEEEVAAAKAMGFNTLRLHVKAFEPTYLDVCDEIGMLLHCDIPVAEPLVHDDMGGDTLLTRRCLATAREQVRRDRNHPSVVLWSAMNEVCEGNWGARGWPGYEALARAMYASIVEADPTRPIIENDWIEPDPSRVFVSPLLTAHRYGRLHQEYLARIEAEATRWESEERILLVTEFGDWGLPEMPDAVDAPFWDFRQAYAAGLQGARWPGSLARFVFGSHHYQGLSDRLQAEVFRRHDHIGGYCLTELTDVPKELNGILDVHRTAKRATVAEMTRANRVVLPMLRLGTLVANAGGSVEGALHVANDGPPLAGVTVETTFEGPGEGAVVVDLGDVAGWSAMSHDRMDVVAPAVTGRHDLLVRLSSAGRVVTENRYPIHVVAAGALPVDVRLLGGGPTVAALRAVGASVAERGPTVVAEDGLDAVSAPAVLDRLAAGEVVVVLAQPASAAPWFPVDVELAALTSVWGSTVFRFTTDHGAVPSLPRRAVLVAEDATIQPSDAVTRIAGEAFPDTPVVVAFKPDRGALAGTVLGSHAVGDGRLVLCQYRLAAGAASGDPAASAQLTDVLRWAAEPRPAMARDRMAKQDGRSLTAYSWRDATAI